MNGVNVHICAYHTCKWRGGPYLIMIVFIKVLYGGVVFYVVLDYGILVVL